MGLLLYPLFAAMALMFWALLIATAITIYVGAYAIVALLTLGAMIVRSAWRPLYPRRPPRSTRSLVTVFLAAVIRTVARIAVSLDERADDLSALLGGQPVHTDHYA
jgi:branched-subunit amino acid ABC-type transport system permease component